MTKDVAITPPMFETGNLVKPGALPEYGGGRGITALTLPVRPGTDLHAVLGAYVQAGAPLTDHEAAEIAGLGDRPGAQGWPRINELLEAGYIEMVGRRPNASGRMVRECRATQVGETTWS